MSAAPSVHHAALCDWAALESLPSVWKWRKILVGQILTAINPDISKNMIINSELLPADAIGGYFQIFYKECT